MMKHAPVVVQIITKLELGGAQKVCLTIAEGLSHNNITHYLISGTQGPLTTTVKKWDNAFLLPELQREISKNVLEEFKAFYKLYQTLRTLRIKHQNIIVHTHSTKAGIMGRWAAFCAGIKKRVHTVHGFGFHEHQSWIPWFIHYALELVTSLITTHYICVSSHDIATGIKRFPRFANKHSLIRAAVDFKPFIPARTTQLKNHEFTFGTVACFKPQKNLFDLLHAFKAVHTQKPHVKLEIVGDGILRPDIEAWINDNKLSQAITLHGWQHNVAPFLHQWDAFVLSSLWEGLPCAVVEARICKLPVLSYDTGGIHDIIFHEKNGLLYPQKEWYNLANGMLSVATNKNYANTLRTFNDELSDFQSDRMIQKHIELYQQM